MGNTFGKYFRVTTFGESHGKGIGLILDGCPAGLKISQEEIQYELDRRKPGQSKITTQRKEEDLVEILSGIKEGITLGTPIGLVIKNQDQRPKAYDNLKDLYRPSHADYTYDMRYGIRDPDGGGRSSNRESAARVAAGAIAKKMISELNGIEVLAWVSQIQDIQAEVDPDKVEAEAIDSNIVRCPDFRKAEEMEELICKVRGEGNSLGGIITFCVRNAVPGLGAPVFDKLTADMAKALISINATRGFQIGLGDRAVLLKGSEHNDEFCLDDEGKIRTATNRSGGVQGGMSNGETIYGTVSFKPTATIFKEQKTVDKFGKESTFKAGGRHDPCVLPRAVPIVEAMIRITFADHLLSYSLASMDRLKRVFSP